MQLPSFIKQTALRTSVIFLVKIIGFTVRIPLFRILGSEGTGIYQIVYSVYGFVLTLLTGGFPTSLALTTAKNKQRGRRLFKGLVIPFLVFGGISSLICYALAPQTARLLGDSQLEFPIRCLAPALLVVPLLQLFRGFLQGIEFYGYIAASELIEQTVRVSTMLLFVLLWINYGTHAAAGGAVFGACTGAIAALWFLWLTIYKKGLMNGISENSNRPSFIVGSGILLLLKTSFAISLTRLIMPAADFLDALIIPNRLQESGLNQSDAISIYGEIFGMASIIVYMPTILTAALSYTIAAKLAADWQNNNKDSFVERSRLSIEIGWLSGIASMLFFFFHADELSVFIFGNSSAAKAIRFMAFAPLIVGIRELITTVLWASDFKRAPLTGLILGLICSTVLGYYLTAIPGFGYAGAAISVLVLELTALLWNVAVLQKRCKGAFPVLLLSADLLLLVTIGFLCTKQEFSILHNGILGSIRSFENILIFTGCIILYILIRFWRITKRRNEI
ncbi:oligosaccharide flippase family protein [Paenibacillus larvae]|uniref:oligosaccharide flippase family protein n=1 Tax=Paenibacillus larvae TaxID=1464 RepID=UPI0023A928C9|nr:oligosaccharide flippase family protein [Paenibacillus larvae]MDE5143130.1 oligosaccharide flippase family protein [Paenibacillus larvae subsp. larvae]